MYIKLKHISDTLFAISNTFNVNAELYNYSDSKDSQLTTKVFTNYVKIYVNEKIALEIKFDKKSKLFKEFMCDAKRSRFVADKLVNTFRDKLDYRYTKKQTFVQCNEITESFLDTILYHIVLYALVYDTDANSALYKKCAEMRK